MPDAALIEDWFISLLLPEPKSTLQSEFQACCNRKPALVTIRDNRRKAPGRIGKLNRVLPERLVVNLKRSCVATNCHGIRIAIDRDSNLLTRVIRVGEGKLGLQFVAPATMLAAHLERNQI